MDIPKPTPMRLRHAHLGSLLSPTSNAVILAAVANGNTATAEEIKQKLKAAHRPTRDTYNHRCPTEAGLLLQDPEDEPDIFLDFATSVHTVRLTGGAARFTRHNPDESGPRRIDSYFNAQGRALEATGNGEHPDIGPAEPIRPSWYNATNVR